MPIRDGGTDIKVERDGPMPVARQLAARIRQQIEQGELKPGDRLPTEQELCAQLGVSRTPVRRALKRLTEEGLLVRYPGRGTFVSQPTESAGGREAIELTVTLTGSRWCWPLQQAAQLWNAEHPDQPVRLRFGIVDFVHLRSHLTLAVAQGTVSDLSLIDSVWVAEFADRGYLQALNAIDVHRAEELATDMVPQIRALHTVDGELYAAPADADIALLWYRKDWFEQEGLEPPRSWDEWLDRARHFRSPAVRTRYGLANYPLAFLAGPGAGETTTYQLLPVLWSAGADVINGGRVVLNSPAAQRAVTFVADLVRRHRVAAPEVVSLPWNGPALAFAAGSVAMALGGSYERRLIQSAAGWSDEEFNQRVGLAPIPAGPGGSPATLVGGLSYAIFRQSRHPTLAMELIVRACRPEIVREFCRRTGQNPPTISGTKAMAVDPDPFHAATADLASHARSRWPLVEYQRVSAQIGRMFESAIVGELEPDEAVARAAAVIAGITGLPERQGRRASWRGALNPVTATTGERRG
ncbi:MAG TPA: extracellular solute-binding protein [Thermomicrobiales bacterium]